MFLGFLLLGCPEPSSGEPAVASEPDAPEETDAPEGPTLVILEPEGGFSLRHGDTLRTRVSLTASDVTLRWSVNGVPVQTCPSAADALACELSGLAEGDVLLCVDGDGLAPACVEGNVHACVHTLWYPDGDGDGYGAGGGAVTACEGPVGSVRIDGDCDDADASVHPGASETCNGRDDDCDSFIDIDTVRPPTWFVDADGDGHGTPERSVSGCVSPAGHVAEGDDCDDSDALVNPYRPEVCNDRDDDCDGVPDDGAIDAAAWYGDGDGDGYGDRTVVTRSCLSPPASVGDATDCDDADPAVNPAAAETCNNLDDDCDGTIDDDAADVRTWYTDADGDGHGNPAAAATACAPLPGTVSAGSDCDDTNGAVSPDATERCNGRDDDCEGTTDGADAADVATWYADADGDGHGSPAASTVSCVAPGGAVAHASDCDDADAAVSPAALELCNERDDDCDGVTDEPDAADAPVWFEDGDGDGYGDPGAALQQCELPVGWVADDTDCDDLFGDVFPGASEMCDGADDDCDGEVDEDDAEDAPAWYLDVDGDGWGLTEEAVRACTVPEGRAADPGDCDDGARGTNPGATEVCNDADDDCDGLWDESEAADADEWYADLDGDGFGDPEALILACKAPVGAVADATDCDDASADAWPGADELCDGFDQDCDGVVDEDDALDASTWYADADGDGYGDARAPTEACEAPDAYVADDTDCDDADAAVRPDATERLDGADDDCDGTVDEVGGVWETDLVANGDFELGDLTGWTHETGPCDVVSTLDWITPYDGSHMFYSGNNAVGADCLVSQSFDLVALGFAAEDLDSGRAGLDVTGVLANEIDVPWARPFPTYDRTLLRVRYLDEFGVELGTLRTLLSEEDGWAPRGTGGAFPEGTRHLDLELEGKLRKGADIDSVADAVSMSITVETPSSPAITKLPFLQDFRQDAMRLLWETDGNDCAHVVEWAAEGQPLTNVVKVVHTVEVDSSHFVHVATIEGLEAGTTYDYRVGSGDTFSDTYTFRSAPAEGEPFKIGWTGDNEWGTSTFTGFLQGMLDREVDLYFSPGDIVWNGDQVADWHNEWFAPLETSNFSQTRPVMFARGNHDSHYSLAYAYSALPENEDWYSFSYGNVFFVALDSNSESDSAVTVLSQMEYLEGALASEEALLADFRVVVFHNAPYTNARHDDSQRGMQQAQRDWVPLFESYGVDLVIGGHFHSYQRGTQNGVTYLVVGGAGGYLDDRHVELYDFFEVVELSYNYAVMEVDGTTLTWTAWDEAAVELDTFTLTAE